LVGRRRVDIVFNLNSILYEKRFWAIPSAKNIRIQK